MPIFLAALSRWFFAGGWRIVLGALSAVIIGLFVARINHWRNESARAEILDTQIADTSKREDAVLAKLVEAEQKRGAAEAALSAWQSFKDNTLTPIKESGRNASATTNPACAPSASDRELRNSAIKQLLGPSGSSGNVSASTGPAH